MNIEAIKKDIPEKVYTILSREITELRPAQEKAVKAGLLQENNLLICTPTASGKTLIAELAITKNLAETGGKAIYIVPLKALASEKYKNFKEKYGKIADVALSIGNLDSADPYLAEKDIIICTAEKLDSLLRHHAPWIAKIKTVVVDEVHLLTDPSRGPTLEILLTMLKSQLPDMQLLALSATIGNPEELAHWLEADLVEDTWRPVQLKKGTAKDNQIVFYG